MHVDLTFLSGIPGWPGLALAAGAFLVPATLVAQSHPLDPLTSGEINQTVRILRASGRATATARAPIMRIHEWPKARVLEWQSGEPVPRAAEAYVSQGDKLFHAVVDLEAERVESWQEMTATQPPLLARDGDRANAIVRADPRWRAAMAARNIRDTQNVLCMPVSAGYFGRPKDRSHRLVHVLCFYNGVGRNYQARMISGLSILVNISENRIEEFNDSGPRPIPGTGAEYEPSLVPDTRPGPNEVRFRQVGSDAFRIRGHQIAWDNWRFHYRFDPQTGLILSLLRYLDGERERSLAYQIALSEIFVPYMDPGRNWHYRAFLDVGEYALGLSASPLEPGRDCPINARVLDVVLAGDDGRPKVIPRALAVFERYTGDPLWRHRDLLRNWTESRRDQELVLRWIATSGNYDYVFDYVFRLDGSIRLRVGATGIAAAKAVKPETVRAATPSQQPLHGRFVAPHTVAVNHGHFVNFRVDLDVDGTTNSFVRTKLRHESYGPEIPRRSGWRADDTVLRREHDARLIANQLEPAVWRVIHSTAKNAWGNPISYRIMPHGNAVSLLDPADWPQRRAAFSAYNLHVTPFEDGEKHAAGAFPNQADGRDGLGAWTRANRSIEARDIVVWYTMGFHHVVRAEDWPVMPVSWHSFELKPFDFFDRNPAIGLLP